MVLPVPGLPTNTRWRLVSSVGSPRVVAQLLHLEEVGHQLHLPLHVLQADQGPQIGQELLEGTWRGVDRFGGRAGPGGRGGGGGPTGSSGRRTHPGPRGPGGCILDGGGRVGAGGVVGPRHGVQQQRAVPLDGEELGAGHMGVERGDGVGDAHGPLVVGGGVAGVVAGIDADEDVEERRRALQEALLARDHAGRPKILGSGPDEIATHAGSEGGDEGPQLVVGLQPVAVDEGGRQVEGLLGHVVAEALGAQIG